MGGFGGASNNSFFGSQMQLQKKWMDAQSSIAKNQMMLFTANEMVLLQTELQATAQTQLNTCDWKCVNDCALTKLDLISKVDCLDTCKCFQASASA
jgi:hypothetical protein